MTPSGALATVALAAAGLMALAPPAAAAAAGSASADVRFTASSLAAPTGVTFSLRYRAASDPQAKPPAIAEVRLDFPPGTVFDGGAVPTCEASDLAFRLLGRDACPAASRIGRGTLVAVTGFGRPVDPVRSDVAIFNGGDEIIELVTFSGTNITAGLDRLRILGTRLEAHPPATPGGPPDLRTAIADIDLVVDPPAANAKPFVRTPPTCPAAGAWTITGRFAFEGGSVATTESRSACPAPRQARRRCRPRRESRARRGCARPPARRAAGRP